MKFLRIGICALIVFGIAAHGAVETWAQAVLETGAALLFIAWSVRQYFTDREIVLSPLLLPLIALSLLALGQLAFRGIVSHRGRLAWFRLVHYVLRVSRRYLRHPSAPHL